MEATSNINAMDNNMIIISNYDTGNEERGSRIIWIMIGLTIMLLIIFAISMILFFVFANRPAMHEIGVINNSSQTINVLVGSQENTNYTIGPMRLNPGQINYIYATPGASLIIQGYYDETILPDSYPYPFTKLKMLLAGEGYDGRVQITDGNSTINLSGISNSNNEDIYDVSIQDGININMEIISTNFNNRNINDQYSCVGPNFGFGLACPQMLQYPTSGTGIYQACMTPCFMAIEEGITGATADEMCCVPESICSQTGTCQNSWIESYNVFYNICPKCMITNCDVPIYHCGSVNGLTQYEVSFNDLR